MWFKKPWYCGSKIFVLVSGVLNRDPRLVTSFLLSRRVVYLPLKSFKSQTARPTIYKSQPNELLSARGEHLISADCYNSISPLQWPASQFALYWPTVNLRGAWVWPVAKSANVHNLLTPATGLVRLTMLKGHLMLVLQSLSSYHQK